ncbi:MAG: signal peptidase II [Candidatus Kapaibacterium sp.]|nr:MAG: signal peptidase II [Candidatus Kapabacteria bacterium]
MLLRSGGRVGFTVFLLLNSSRSMRIRNAGFILFSLCLILLDQATKIAVKGFHIASWKHQGMTLYESIEIIGDTVRCTFVENPGMAFGISFGAGKIFLSLFSVLASGVLVWYLARLETPSFGAKLALALIFAGATGNLIDRVFYGVFYGETPLFYGKVVDFIDVDIPDLALFGREYTRFWVFNVADSCVSVGMAFMLFFNKHLPFLQEQSSQGTTSEAASNLEMPMK